MEAFSMKSNKTQTLAFQMRQHRNTEGQLARGPLPWSPCRPSRRKLSSQM